MQLSVNPHCRTSTLNESPSEKEGKSRAIISARIRMSSPLNESPSEKEGKFKPLMTSRMVVVPSMKVPPKRKGNTQMSPQFWAENGPSMKVPPKRKGNFCPGLSAGFQCVALNESPSEKEGKCRLVVIERCCHNPSMKVPPKRKGNDVRVLGFDNLHQPSMKVPPKRKGNLVWLVWSPAPECPSMKVPPKRKGNSMSSHTSAVGLPLNESPSEKEGKWCDKSGGADSRPPQ